MSETSRDLIDAWVKEIDADLHAATVHRGNIGAELALLESKVERLKARRDALRRLEECLREPKNARNSFSDTAT